MALTLRSISGKVAFGGRYGVNIGEPLSSWGFTAIPGHVYLSDPYQGTFDDEWTNGDLVDIYNKGFDHVRLMVEPGIFLTQLKANGNVANAAFDTAWTKFKVAIDMCLAAGLKVVWDGGHIFTAQNGNYDGEWHYATILAGTGAAAYITFKAYHAIIAARIAALYSPTDVAIELCNEPPSDGNFSGWLASTWEDTIQPDLYTAVRAAAPKHTIIVGAGGFNSIDRLPNLDPTDYGANTIYNFHPYLPTIITLQAVASYPYVTSVDYPLNQGNKAADIARMTTNVNATALSGAEKTALISQMTTDINSLYSTDGLYSTLKTKFDAVTTWCTANGVSTDAIWAGEFGVSQDFAPTSYLGASKRTRRNLYADLINLCNTHGFRWSLFVVDYADFNITDGDKVISGVHYGGKGTFYSDLLPAITPPRTVGSHG